MKKLLTLFCALLGFGAMASADPSVNDNGYLDISATSNEGLRTYVYDSNVATITINAPQWTETDKDNAEAYASSNTTVNVTEQNLWAAGLTAYDQETYEVTQGDVFYYWDNGLWKCIGWWLGGFDASAYDKVVVTLSSTSVVTVCIQDAMYDGNTSSSSVVNDNNDELVEVPLSTLTYKNAIQQVYVQNTEANQVITVKSVQFVAEEVVEEAAETVYTYDFTEGIDISSLELTDEKNSLVASTTDANDAIAYFTENSVSTKKGEGDGVLELYGAKNGKDNGPYAGTVNDDDTTPILWTSGKTQSSSNVWYDYFKVNVPEENIGQYITISADYISGKNVEDRYLVVDKTLSDISSEDVVAINSHLASSVSSGQSADNKATTTYYGTTALTESDAFYLIASNNVGVYSIIVTFSTEAPTETSTTVAVAEPEPTEIEGYLTVTVAGAEVTKDEAVTITVTEGDDNEMTVAIDELNITETIKLTDVAVVFTPEDGEYTEGAVSGEVYISGSKITDLSGVTATGTYVVDGDVVTFTAGFTYSGLTIAVSFTTEVPVVEEWTLITNEFDVALPGELNGSNYSITLTWEELDAYEYLKVEAVTTGTNSTYGCVLAGASWSSTLIYSFTSTGEAGEQEEVIFEIADLKEQCLEYDEASTAVYFVFWQSDIKSVAIYASADYVPETSDEESSEVGPQWKVAFEGYAAGWNSKWTGTASEQGVLELEVSIETIIASDGGTDLPIYDENGEESGTFSWTKASETGGVMLQVWNVTSEDEGTTIAWTCTVTSAEGVEKYTDSDTGVIGTDYEISEYNAITLGDYKTALCYDNYVFEDGDIFYASVEVVTDEGIDTAISNVSVEVTEVARYNLMGQKISGAEKGINIIVYSDGSAKKVLVK